MKLLEEFAESFFSPISLFLEISNLMYDLIDDRMNGVLRFPHALISDKNLGFSEASLSSSGEEL